MQLATFSYLVISRQGKENKGTMDADTREAAMEELRRAGNVIISVDEVGLLSKDIKLSSFSSNPKPRDMAVFCRQFVSIINAGVPVVTALDMLSEQTENKKLAKSLADCKKTIEQGETLAHAMGEWPEVFPPMLVTLVAAGEASGSLEVSFSRMADQFEKDAKTKASIRKATIYPTFLLIVAFSAVVLLLIFVVPTFESMLSSLGTKMPGITSAVLSIARFLQHWWYILLVVIAAIVVSMHIFAHSNSGQYFFGKVALKLPLIGQLTTKTASARMARTLGTLLGAGLPLVDSLTIVAGTMTNIYFKDILIQAREAVILGSSLSSQFAKSHLFPPLVYHMIGIGEESGSVEHMLDKLAEYYEEEVENATERAMAALEPAIIVVMAIIIGVIVVSIVLPMASMYNGLGNL